MFPSLSFPSRKKQNCLVITGMWKWHKLYFIQKYMSGYYLGLKHVMWKLSSLDWSIYKKLQRIFLKSLEQLNHWNKCMIPKSNSNKREKTLSCLSSGKLIRKNPELSGSFTLILYETIWPKTTPCSSAFENAKSLVLKLTLPCIRITINIYSTTSRSEGRGARSQGGNRGSERTKGRVRWCEGMVPLCSLRTSIHKARECKHTVISCFYFTTSAFSQMLSDWGTG